MATRDRKRDFKNISNSWMNTCSFRIDKLKRCIITSPFFTKIIHSELPCDRMKKKRSRSPKHYTPILKMYRCKFGQNISTRCCSDGMQISFFLQWAGYFDIGLVGEKSCP